MRIREVASGKGLRLYQVRKEGDRHLADIRSEDVLPDMQVIENLQVMSPVDLIVSKVLSYEARREKPK